MILPADVLFACLAVVTFVGYRRRRDRLFLAALPIALVALVFDLVRHFPAVEVRFGLLDAVLVALAAALAAEVQGLPPVLARRLRFGRRSREWEFDHLLHLYREMIDTQLLRYPPSRDWDAYSRWRRRTLEVGQRAIGRMERLASPTPEWATVRDDYVALYREIINRVEGEELPDDEWTSQRGLDLKERAARLRQAYRSEFGR